MFVIPAEEAGTSVSWRLREQPASCCWHFCCALGSPLSGDDEVRLGPCFRGDDEFRSELAQRGKPQLAAGVG